MGFSVQNKNVVFSISFSDETAKIRNWTLVVIWIEYVTAFYSLEFQWISTLTVEQLSPWANSHYT